jgi:hypothetical protein
LGEADHNIHFFFLAVRSYILVIVYILLKWLLTKITRLANQTQNKQ